MTALMIWGAVAKALMQLIALMPPAAAQAQRRLALMLLVKSVTMQPMLTVLVPVLILMLAIIVLMAKSIAVLIATAPAALP